MGYLSLSFQTETHLLYEMFQNVVRYCVYGGVYS